MALNEKEGSERGDQEKDSGKMLSRKYHLACLNEIPLLLCKEQSKKKIKTEKGETVKRLLH